MINLLPKAEKQLSQAELTLNIFGGLLVLFAFMSLSYSAFFKISTNATLDQYKVDLGVRNTINQKIIINQDDQTNYDIIADRKQAYNQEKSHAVNFGALLDKIASVTPANLEITKLDLNPYGSSLEGVAQDSSAVTTFSQKLGTISILNTVSLVSTASTEKGVSFILSLALVSPQTNETEVK